MTIPIISLNSRTDSDSTRRGTMEINAELKELLFGMGEDRMDLTSVRVRVEDLMNRIDSVLACLSSESSVETKWKVGLDAYSLVNVHLQRLLHSAKPLMRRYVVCPVQYDPSTCFYVTGLADMLATQLHQEQETTSQTIGEEMTKDDEELSRAIERIDERNELIMDLIKVSRKPGSGLLDPKASA